MRALSATGQDIPIAKRHVCFSLNSGHEVDVRRCLLSAKSCREQVQQNSATQSQLQPRLSFVQLAAHFRLKTVARSAPPISTSPMPKV